MKKDTDKTQMMLASSIKPKSIVVAKDYADSRGRKLVIAVGYSKDGEFGYFTCWEYERDGVFYYQDQISFKKKVNEHTYSETLREFAGIVDSYKNK